MSRVSSRTLRLWHSNYLANLYLWRTVEMLSRIAMTKCNSRVPLIIDVGCGRRPYRNLFCSGRYVGLNFTAEDADPDVLSDAAKLPIRSASVDIVLCTQVIEHVADPAAVIDELWRVLKPGGNLIITAPFHWPLHEEPTDYFRFTCHGLSMLMNRAGIDQYEIMHHDGDWAQICCYVNLKLSGKLWAPVRSIVNLMGLLLNSVFPEFKSVMNYSVSAWK